MLTCNIRGTLISGEEGRFNLERDSFETQKKKRLYIVSSQPYYSSYYPVILLSWWYRESYLLRIKVKR